MLWLAMNKDLAEPSYLDLATTLARLNYLLQCREEHGAYRQHEGTHRILVDLPYVVTGTLLSPSLLLTDQNDPGVTEHHKY